MLKNPNLAIIATTLLLIVCLMLAFHPSLAAILAFFVGPIFILWMTASILQPTAEKIPDLPENGDLRYLDLP